MRTHLLALTSAAFLLASCGPTTGSVITPASSSSMTTSMAGMDQSMHAETASSAGVDYSSRIENSPRHAEWVEVKNADKTVYAWVVYPETQEKRPVVILIHENRGLNDWARGMADQVAEAGYIAVAPDLLSDFSKTEKRTKDFTNEDAARDAISQLTAAGVTSDLKAVAAWAETIPASNGKLASAGFCWGGGQSFQFATESKNLDMTMVFYGTGPTDSAAYAKVTSPVYGFYAGDDARVNATVMASEEQMTKAGKRFEYVTYDGAGHAFMRSGEDPNGTPANVAARNAAWNRMKQLLSTL